MTALWAWIINSRLARYVGLALAALAAIKARDYSRDRDAAQRAALEAENERLRRMEDARNAIIEEIADTRDFGERDLLDRLRKRGDDFGGL